MPMRRARRALLADGISLSRQSRVVQPSGQIKLHQQPMPPTGLSLCMYGLATLLIALTSCTSR